jgi:hypothetical protein
MICVLFVTNYSYKFKRLTSKKKKKFKFNTTFSLFHKKNNVFISGCPIKITTLDSIWLTVHLK